MPHKIAEVLPGSIADELEICAGDILLRLDGARVRDVFDYKFAVCADEILLEIEKPGGEIWEFEIEKDADEDLGLVFERPLMSAKRRCRNRCIFCFIDQQPPGLRRSLYFKDDDVRLSFLHGNYVTLTNLSQREIRRFAGYHLSPLRVSVHATDIELRKKMMGCDAAANLFEALQIFADAGIEMHFQVVLCKGYNDGAALEQTISELSRLKGAASLAIVPAGITRFRESLAPLEQFTPEEARAVIAQISRHGKNFVYAADEWYIMADEPLPPYEDYGDFPQLDNGVGMLRLFEREFLSAPKGKPRYVKIAIATGQAAGEFMRGLAAKFMLAHPGVEISVHIVRNDFFGENITVSGLLTGADIIAQLQGIEADVLFLPGNAFCEEKMLDGTTIAQLTAALCTPVQIASTNGKAFAQQILLATTEPHLPSFRA